MAEELKACGKNGYGETFWKLCVPDEHCSPGLEVGISAGDRGVTIGGRLIKWTELDTARAQLPSHGGEAVEVVAYRYTSGQRLGGKWHYQESFPKWDDRKVREIGQMDELMTVAQHQRILAASVGSGEPVAWRVTGNGRLTVTTQYPSWAGCDPALTITPLYTRPADQVAEGVVVSRELLKGLAHYLECSSNLTSDDYGSEGYDYAREIRALLAKSEAVKK